MPKKPHPSGLCVEIITDDVMARLCFQIVRGGLSLGREEGMQLKQVGQSTGDSCGGHGDWGFFKLLSVLGSSCGVFL